MGVAPPRRRGVRHRRPHAVPPLRLAPRRSPRDLGTFGVAEPVHVLGDARDPDASWKLGTGADSTATQTPPRTRTTPRTTLLTPTRPRPRGCTRRRSRTVRRARLKSERAPSGFRFGASTGPEPASAPSSASSSLASSPRASVGSDAGHRAFSFDTPESGLPPLAPRTPGFGSRGSVGSATSASGSGFRSARNSLDGTSPVVGTPAVGVGTPAVGTPTAAAPASSAPSRGALAVASIFTSKYLQARRKYRRVQFFSNLRGVSETWELLGGARRVDDGWRGWGALDGARQSPPPAEESGGKPSPFPAEESALAREMASLFGVARAEPRRLGGRDFCVVRSRRNPAVALLLVRLTLPTGESVTSETPGNPRRFRENAEMVGVVRGGGGTTRGVAGIDRGRHLRGVGRVAGDERDGRRAHEQPTPSKFRAKTRETYTAARSRRGVERRSPRATRDASPRRRSFDRIVGDARARRSRAPRASNVACSREDPSGGTSGARGVAREGARVGVERRLLEVAPKGCRATRRSKNHRARRSRRLARVHVARVRRVAASRVRQRRGEVRVREGIVAVATTGEGATVSSVARAREVSHRRARCAPSRFRTRLQTRAAPTRVARVFALASVDDVGKSSENRRTRGDAHVRASRRDARDARLARGIGARAARARRRRTRPTRVGSNPSAPRVFVFLGVAIFGAPRDGSGRARVASTRRRMFAARGFKNMVHVPKDEARARATPRDDALETVRHEARDRSVGVRGYADRVLRRRRVSATYRAGGDASERIFDADTFRAKCVHAARRRSGMATRRVVFHAWRASRARRTSRARRRGSIDAVREEEGFSPAEPCVSAWRYAAEEATISRRRVEKMAFRRVVDATADAFARWGAYARASATARRLARRATDRFRGKRLATAFFEWARAAAESAARRARDAADHLAADAARGRTRVWRRFESRARRVWWVA